MNRIRIISNPYEKQTVFEIYQANTDQWVKINSVLNPNSKLIGESMNSAFFPFKIKDIVNIIYNEYGIGEDKIEICFQGTEDHFNELKEVINDGNWKCEIIPTLEGVYLLNAEDVLPEIIDVFNKLKPIIDKSETHQDEISNNLHRFTDSAANQIPLCVIGNYSSGKSTFINSLIGKEILPSGDDPVTAKIYRIEQIEEENRAYIEFTYNKESVQIVFKDDSYDIYGILPPQVEQEIRKSLDSNDENNITKSVGNCINCLNGLHDDYLSSIIKIKISFSNGVLQKAESKFIILDTPGDNSASNIAHSNVLNEALAGLTNGLPIYVSLYEALDTNDNLQLYGKIRAMREIDSRFTMIIANKADTNALPEEGYFTEEKEEETLGYAVPRNMYSIGIYFVSSILGLGYKTHGKFNSKNGKLTYKKNKPLFEDEEDEDCIRLYKYNIIPSQLKKEINNKCKDSKIDRIYVNSGLYAVELSIVHFAEKYAAYNKCQQSLYYLKNMISFTEEEINILKQSSEKNKKELENTIEAKKAALIKEIEDVGENGKRNDISIGEYKLTDFKVLKTPTITIEELKQKEEENAKINKEIMGYKEQQSERDEALKQLGSNFKNNAKNIFANGISGVSLSKGWSDLIRDSEKITEKTGTVIRTKIQVDKQSVDNTVYQVNQESKSKLSDFRYALYTESENFWNEKSEEIRDELLRIIAGTDVLDEAKKNKIKDVIMRYEHISYDIDKNDSFEIEDYRNNFRNKLKKKKLSDDVNREYRDWSDRIYNEMITSHVKSFRSWTTRLLNLIKENIVDYSPELLELQLKLNAEIAKIQDLEDRQTLIQDKISYIQTLMDWHLVDSEEE